jgi:hypothetical protein
MGDGIELVVAGATLCITGASMVFEAVTSYLRVIPTSP